MRAGDEHPIRRLEHERKRGRFLEREPIGDRVDIRRGKGNQLGVRAVSMLADDVDRPVGGLDSRVDHDVLARLEAGHTGAERLDDPGSVGPEDARLRH